MKISELKDYHVLAPAPQVQPRSTVKDLFIGAAKGLGDTVNSTFETGKAIQRAIDPTPDNRFSSNVTPINPEMLKSDNNTQKTGKVLEFAAEVLFPSGLATKGAKATGAIFKGASSKVASIGDDVLDGGGKVKDQLVDLLVSLDDKTKTALTRTPRDVFDAVVKQGREAMLDDRNRTPLEAVGDKVIESLKQIKDRASSIGQAKSQIMEQAKVGYNKVGNIAQRAALDIQKSFSGMKLDPSDLKIVDGFKETLMKLGGNPSLREVDATIDLLQDQLYKAGRSNAVEVTDRITGKLRTAIGKLNGQVKTLGGEAYAKANQEYAELADIVRELNARLGKEGSSAGALVKRLFSPSDARTKELFEKLEQLTGQDFFRDARLAKFVMETLGDTRAASLLQQIPTSAKGAVEKVFEYGMKKITDPIKAAEKYLKE